MKFSDRLLLQKVIYSSFHLTMSRPDRVYISALLCLLGIGIVSPPALSQPIDTLPPVRDSSTPGELTPSQAPIAIADAAGLSTASDNFNPGLQLPPPKSEQVPLTPKPLQIQPNPESTQPASATTNLTNPQRPVASPTRPEPIAELSGSNNFNPALQLPPPKTEPLPPPPEKSKSKPVGPEPEIKIPGRAQTKPGSGKSSPAAAIVPPANPFINLPGRSRLGETVPQPIPSKPESTPTKPVRPEAPKPELSLPKPSIAKGPILILESVVPDFKSTRNESGQINQIAETTATFLLENGDRIKLRSGYNTFIKPGFTAINNTPIAISWEKKIDTVTIEPSIGVDLFDRLSATPTYGLKVAVPVTPGLTISGAAEYGIYKFNNPTIQNQVTALRFGPGLFWQIDRDTSLLAIYKYGMYSDNNTENQLFSRLERKAGQFWIAANLFSWGFEKNIGDAKGYFSPPDFLAYSGEVGVEGNILYDSLSCRLSAQLGNQESKGALTLGQAYQALCKAKLSPSLEANFGYAFGNSRKDFSSEETGHTNTITGGLIYKF